MVDHRCRSCLCPCRTRDAKTYKRSEQNRSPRGVTVIHPREPHRDRACHYHPYSAHLFTIALRSPAITESTPSCLETFPPSLGTFDLSYLFKARQPAMESKTANAQRRAKYKKKIRKKRCGRLERQKDSVRARDCLIVELKERECKLKQVVVRAAHETKSLKK